MRESDLSTVLREIHHGRGQLPDAPIVRQQLLTVPLAPTPQQRGWLPPVRTWGFTSLSAVKLIAAAAIVALFGGFLLRGALTTHPGDGVTPAAVTASPAPEVEHESPPPAPMTTVELLSDMVTEEIEPGVLRVANDGVRDLARAPGGGEAFEGVLDGNIVAGLDGSVWLFEQHRFFRLGDEAQVAPGWRLYKHDADIEVAPNGDVWLIAEREDGLGDLVWFADRLLKGENATIWGDPSFPEYADRDYLAVEVVPDERILSAWFEGLDRSKVAVGQFYGGWAPFPTAMTVPGARDVDPMLKVSGDDIWLAEEGETLRVLAEAAPEGPGWEVHQPPFEPRRIDVGVDGTLWIQAHDPQARLADTTSAYECGLRLARFDGSDWNDWDGDDGVPEVGPVFFYGGCQEGVHAVAPDGSVWLAPLDFMGGRECSGIANFDGTTWTRYIDGLCVYDADVAPDGAIWLQAGEVKHLDGPVPGPVYTYVITPEVAESQG